MGETDQNGTGRSLSKVDRLIDVYGLDREVGAELEVFWTADDDRRESLRSLADRFNKQLLRSALADAGRSVIDGEVSNLYRLLTDDEVSSGTRLEARRRLEEQGVAVEQLLDDFVSYQAIRYYLTEYRDAEYDQPTNDPVETTREQVTRLQSRLRSVAESRLDRLRQGDDLTLGEYRVFVDVDVLCEECDTQYSIGDLLRRGGCECER
jgi:hypothetical protein